MSYKSLLAHVCVGHDNRNVCSISAQLADMFDARIIGIAGAQLMPPLSEVPVADMMQYERAAAENSLKQLEQDFRTAFRDRKTRVDWRASCDFNPVGTFVARESRAADLVIAAPEAGAFQERIDQARLGPLVLEAGRPVLIVPSQQRELNLRKVVVAWKDTREARRAVADALPLLQKAQGVLVAEICPPADVASALQRTTDVAGWLKEHNVASRAIAEPWEGSDLSGMHAMLRKEGCDLVVAGAYGHTRLREWVFGGVTLDFLLRGDNCVLLSH